MARLGGIPKWLWIASVCVGLSGGVAAAAMRWQAAHAASLCEQVADEPASRRIQICQASFFLTHNPHDLAEVARGYLHIQELGIAETLAQPLLTGAGYDDAHAILSYITKQRGEFAIARAHAAIALVGHAFVHNNRGLARDLSSLSQAARDEGDYSVALDLGEAALQRARQVGEAHVTMTAMLAVADVRRRLGDSRYATNMLQSALSSSQLTACDRTWLQTKVALSEIDEGRDDLAKSELERAARDNKRDNDQCRDKRLTAMIAENTALLNRLKDPRGAVAALDQARELYGKHFEERLLRGYVAAGGGAFDEAEGYFREADQLERPDADWDWELERAEAEVCDLRGKPGDVQLAEQHYRKAIASIAALRGPAGSRVASFVASHRAPYDGLIALFARQGRWRDALEVILELDASDMLRSTTDTISQLGGDADAPDPASSAPIAAPVPAIDDLLAAWRTRDLVILIAPASRLLIPSHEQVYRLRINHGVLTGEAVGDADAARHWVEALLAEPDNLDAAQRLGAMFVPADVRTGELHVLAIGVLGKVAPAMLRGPDGVLLQATHPLLKILAMRARGPESRGAGASVVLADPSGDLHSAALEGFVVAGALGHGTLLFGAAAQFPATRERLWQASNAPLLHLAGHVAPDGLRRKLHLSDGDVTPADLRARHFAPRFAVLASCGSAAATDSEGLGSIAAALLESGTSLVLATDRDVDDELSMLLMTEFYAQPDVHADPARALVRAQQALAQLQHAQSLIAASLPGWWPDPARKPARDRADALKNWTAFFVMARPPEVPERSAARE
ncbi:MAG TPA: CHAT domain-containing protein [Kofleriaceae bacterium]|jgi:tetratricopeptide (TPR) repeat protein|nr:CHAT domain-containing protein [Kofleriaceae bacterium]